MIHKKQVENLNSCFCP